MIRLPGAGTSEASPTTSTAPSVVSVASCSGMTPRHRPSTISALIRQSVQDAPAALGRSRIVNGHVGGARLHDSEQRHDGRDALWKHHSHAIAAFHSSRHEKSRQRIGPAVELRVSSVAPFESTTACRSGAASRARLEIVGEVDVRS